VKVIETNKLCAGYGSVPAVVDVDLRVDEGEMVALLGANGAGKTTTLLAIAGALPASRGTVRLFGRTGRIGIHQWARRGLAFLPAERAVFMSLTVEDNLLLGRGDLRLALEIFPELEGRLGLRAGLLSGGEQQMLAMARILAARPKAILADEVSLGLAPLVVRRLLEALRASTRTGTSVLLVEQHPHTALSWTDRAYVLRRGRVELGEKSSELQKRPSDLAELYL
jgi:branched-chain amino acid transport system ATP-binding protein